MKLSIGAVVVAQLVEQSLPIPEAKIYIEHLLSTVLKRKNEEKEAGNGPFSIG